MSLQAPLWPRLFRLLPALLLFAFAAVSVWPRESGGADFPDNREQRRREVSALMESSTVCVLALGEDGLAFGSGFIVGEGLIMTNAHVVNGAKADGIFVLNEILPLTKAKHVRSAYDSGDLERLRRRDFALLRFTPPGGKNLPALAFTLDVRRMDRVSAWGYPGMITMRDERMQNILTSETLEKNMPSPPVVYTEGTVNALVKSGGEAIIHSAAISAGNSGGPLINAYGEVVGINTWGYKEDDEGAFINAALPAHLMVEFLRGNGVTPKLSERSRLKPGEPLVALGPEAEKTPAKAPAEAEVKPAPESVPTKREGMAYRERPDQDPKEPAPDKAPPARGKFPFNQTETPDKEAPPPNRDERAPKFFGTDADASGANPQANALIKKAEAGDVEAMRAVGASYFSGSDGFAEDYRQAFHWLKKAADAGDPYGQALLGILYLGLHDPDIHDPEKAVDLLRKSASSPEADPEVQAILAEVLYSGLYMGVPFSPDESLQWARLAAKKKESTALALMARQYYDGFVLDQNLTKAGQLANEALGKNPDEPLALGLLAAMAYFDSKSSDMDKTLKLATRSADGGDALGMGILAFIHAFIPEHRNDVEAEKWARQAARQADEHGFYVLGWLYLEGRVVDKNTSLAWAYLSLAEERLGAVDTGEGDTLLQRANKRLSAGELKQAQKLRAGILSDWGLTAYR